MNYFSIPGIFYWAVPLLFVLGMIQIVKRGRKGLWRLGFKETGNSLIWIFGLIYVMFLIVFIVSTTVPITGYFETQALRYETEATRWALMFLPYIYIFTGLMFSIWILVKAWSNPIRYNSKEKEILRKEKMKLKKRLGWFGRFIGEV